MKAPSLALSCAAMALCAPVLASAQSQPANPQIDYDGFVELAVQLAEVREAHRLPTEEFLKKAREEGALLLDTRSVAAFEAGHLQGAVNLPFSDFTEEKLAKVIGEDTSRAIYIYCNNNFSDGVPPVMKKVVTLALNIPTFINLHGYGYTNVWEMAGVTTTAETSWVTAEMPDAPATEQETVELSDSAE